MKKRTNPLNKTKNIFNNIDKGHRRGLRFYQQRQKSKRKRAILSTKTEDAEDENDSIYKDKRDRRSKRTIQWWPILSTNTKNQNTTIPSAKIQEADDDPKLNTSKNISLYIYLI
mgnify:CR=1 FL=1